LFLAIHGIISAQAGADCFDRMGIVDPPRRLEHRLAGPAFADPVAGELAGLDILRMRRISALVASVMMRGPTVYSPYSAVLEIE
jgi:hypothetical protein